MSGSTIHQIRQRLATLPLIDTHDHTNKAGPRYTDPMQVVLGGYFYQDAAKLSSLEQVEKLKDPSIPLEERWPLLQRLWQSARFTGFGRVSARVLRHFYGENELTLDALRRMREKLPDLSDPIVFDRLLEEANIVSRLVSPVGTEYRETVPEVLGGTHRLSPRARLTIRLTPFLHSMTSSKTCRP